MKKDSKPFRNGFRLYDIPPEPRKRTFHMYMKDHEHGPVVF